MAEKTAAKFIMLVALQVQMEVIYLDVPRAYGPSNGGRLQGSNEAADLAAKLSDVGFGVQYGPMYGGIPSEKNGKIDWADGYRFVLTYDPTETPNARSDLLKVVPRNNKRCLGTLDEFVQEEAVAAVE